MSARADRATLLAALALCLCCLVGCSEPHEPDPRELTVAAAASLRDLLQDTAASYRPAGREVDVRFVFGASSRLSRQAEEGAGFDILLSADELSLDRLGQRIDASTRRVFLSNRIALVGREGLTNAPTSPTALVGRGLRLALAGPAVPVGRYAREYLSRVGVLDELQAGIVDAEHVRAVLAMVESGAADCGMVYLSDARIAPSAKLLWTATATANPDVRYVAGIFRSSSSPWADSFLDWLSSEELQAAAELRGFQPPR